MKTIADRVMLLFLEVEVTGIEDWVSGHVDRLIKEGYTLTKIAADLDITTKHLKALREGRVGSMKESVLRRYEEVFGEEFPRPKVAA